MATINDLKSIATAKLGFAKPNQFLVELPNIGTGVLQDVGGPLIGLLPLPSVPGIVDPGTPTTRELNTLCSNVNIPGKQVLTAERRIGMENQRVAYGYAVEEVSMSFYMMNDYGVRRYFDAWISTIINEEGGTAAYKNDYQKSIKIHQLRKPQKGFAANLGPLSANIGLGGGTAYCVELLEAFPVTVLAKQLTNELDGILEMQVQIAYTRWQIVDSGLQNFVEGGVNIGSIFG